MVLKIQEGNIMKKTPSNNAHDPQLADFSDYVKEVAQILGYKLTIPSNAQSQTETNSWLEAGY